jgi:hypothetical protein
LMGTQSATRWPTELPAMDFAEATSLHTFQADNGCNQRLAALGEPHRWILSRVRWIAWFGGGCHLSTVGHQVGTTH